VNVKRFPVTYQNYRLHKNPAEPKTPPRKHSKPKEGAGADSSSTIPRLDIYLFICVLFSSVCWVPLLGSIVGFAYFISRKAVKAV